MKATEGWRTPKRFANCEAASKMQQLLECGSLLLLGGSAANEVKTFTGVKCLDK